MSDASKGQVGPQLSCRDLDSVERRLFGEATDPDSLGRYVLVSKLGSGSMGSVYRAYDPTLDRQVAIKVLHPGEAGSGYDPTGARLLREAQSIAKLCHPNVIAVHDVGAIKDRVFMTMEYVPGQTLREWCHAAPRGWREVVAVMLQVARGLEAAHARGLVHSDVKPDNILVGDDGRVRLLDFSVARASSAELEERLFSVETRLAAVALTQTNALVGTPAYMAPEQFSARPADARSDQFAFCITAYEALFGERPFKGNTIQALADAVLLGPPRTLPVRAPAVPRALFRCLLRGLSVEANDRWPDMRALIVELERMLERQRRRPLLAVAAAVGAAAALFVGAVAGQLVPRAPASTEVAASVASASGASLSTGLCATAMQDAVAVRRVSM